MIILSPGEHFFLSSVVNLNLKRIMWSMCVFVGQVWRIPVRNRLES